jgi:rubrerythrin
MVATENESAVGNLLKAYEGELNAHARYRAYAAKAEDEGMSGAASLFRAAARAEQIHAGNHARVIRHMGGEAVADILPFRVKSTLENLKAALGGEQHEIDSLYPTFWCRQFLSSIQALCGRLYGRWSRKRRTHGSMKMQSPRSKMGRDGRRNRLIFTCARCAATPPRSKKPTTALRATSSGTGLSESTKGPSVRELFSQTEPRCGGQKTLRRFPCDLHHRPALHCI